MKLQDPTLPYVDVVARRRKARAATDGERFRLGVHGLDCGSLPATPGRTAVVGASAWALKTEQLETTLAHIGLVGGLLTDLGFQVCPIGALSDHTGAPSLVAWVCGDETEADEYEQLADIDAPGLSIGSCVDGLDDWGYVQPDDHPRDLEFIDALVAEIHAVIEDDAATRASFGEDETAESSTGSSTGRDGTGPHEVVQAGRNDARKPSSEVLRGTERHGRNRRSGGS